MRTRTIAWGIANIVLLAVLAGIAFHVFKYEEKLENRPVAKLPATYSFQKQIEELNPVEEVPSFDAFIDERGNKVSLADFRGKPIVLNYWATWCPPCVKELPSLARLLSSRDNVAVIALSFDRQQSPQDLRAFLLKQGAESLEVYHSPIPGVLREMRSRGLPTTYLISASGNIFYKIEGDIDWSSEETLGLIDHLATLQ